MGGLTKISETPSVSVTDTSIKAPRLPKVTFILEALHMVGHAHEKTMSEM